jgi:hypothetical protein
MIINIIILIVVVCIAWVVWTERKNKQALNKGGLDQAWREVLDALHYVERRHYEERKRRKPSAGRRCETLIRARYTPDDIVHLC